MFIKQLHLKHSFLMDDVPLGILGSLGCGLLTGEGAVLNVLKLSAGQAY